MISKKMRHIAKALTAAMALSCVVAPLTACGDDDGDKLSNESSPLVLATDVLDGVFNPFFYTSGADGDIVGQTQISMMSSDYKGNIVCGWDEPCVSLASSTVQVGTKADKGNSGAADEYDRYYTEYYFAIKDNIKFSDGVSLTKNDVLFNIYMYLDPSYTGSSTMYSVKIKGIDNYRYQPTDGTSGSVSSNYFTNLTEERIGVLRDWLNDGIRFDVKNDWGEWGSLAGYDDNSFIADDIQQVHELFKEELESDWNTAQASDPVKDFEKYKDENGNQIITEPWQVFLYNYNQWVLNYERDPLGVNNYYKLVKNYTGTATDKDSLIQYVFQAALGGADFGFNDDVTKKADNKVSVTYKENLRNVITYYATASTFATYVRSAVISHEIHKSTEDGSLAFPTVEGVEILENQATIPASETRSAGASAAKDPIVLKDAEESAHSYDVLKITIDGVDPKAIQNFSFTVAPGHYYGQDWSQVGVKENYYGVPFGDNTFMRRVKEKQIPLGAGPYRAATESGSFPSSKSDFYSNNVVMMQRNDHFLLGAPKIKKLRYQVVNSSLLYDNVRSSTGVHYASPSMDITTLGYLNGRDKNSLSQVSTDNLGYGYIGINAREVPNIYVRRAIMTALDANMCVEYYGTENASVIYRPMSKTLKNYYDMGDPSGQKWSETEYYKFDSTGEKITDLLEDGGCQQNRTNGKWTDSDGKALKYTFTIAGDSADHPAEQMMQRAATILNDKGFDITITHDSTALSKLANGQLTVWAAAWSSSSDPDMYQVYHKDSSATSTLAWGYPYLMSNQSTEYERGLLDTLAGYIEQGRETLNESERQEAYFNALNTLMDLAVEFPTYQRKVYYVWKKGVFDESTMFTVSGDKADSVTAYQSPLSRIWEVSFKEG